jgi:hypothetical protein
VAGFITKRVTKSALVLPGVIDQSFSIVHSPFNAVYLTLNLPLMGLHVYSEKFKIIKDSRGVACEHEAPLEPK